MPDLSYRSRRCVTITESYLHKLEQAVLAAERWLAGDTDRKVIPAAAQSVRERLEEERA